CLVDFFFSSRRRHTRSKRDWSSDVCSSDLGITAGSRFRAGKNTFIECLWPPEIKDGQDENENCSVFMVNNNGVRILVTGDLDGRSEERRVGKECGTGWAVEH